LRYPLLWLKEAYLLNSAALVGIGIHGYWLVSCLLRLATFADLQDWTRPCVRAPLRWMRNLSFATGIATLFLALLSPFDALDDQLFSAHMVQHLVLLMVAPPLRISGRPALVTLWAFPLA